MDDPAACIFAGQMYEYARGVKRDDAKATSVYERVCDLRSRLPGTPAAWASGCYNLAIMYERGKGVATERQRAGGLYRVACDGGGRHACDRATELASNTLQPGAQ